MTSWEKKLANKENPLLQALLFLTMTDFRCTYELKLMTIIDATYTSVFICIIYILYLHIYLCITFILNGLKRSQMVNFVSAQDFQQLSVV